MSSLEAWFANVQCSDTHCGPHLSPWSVAITGPSARMRSVTDPPGQVGGDAGTSLTQQGAPCTASWVGGARVWGEGYLGHSKSHTRSLECRSLPSPACGGGHPHWLIWGSPAKQHPPPKCTHCPFCRTTVQSQGWGHTKEATHPRQGLYSVSGDDPTVGASTCPQASCPKLPVLM